MVSVMGRVQGTQHSGSVDPQTDAKDFANSRERSLFCLCTTSHFFFSITVPRVLKFNERRKKKINKELDNLINFV